MEAIRVIREVDSETLTLPELAAYRGRRVEVIIFPLEQEEGEEDLPLYHLGEDKSTLSRSEIYSDDE